MRFCDVSSFLINDFKLNMLPTCSYLSWSLFCDTDIYIKISHENRVFVYFISFAQGVRKLIRRVVYILSSVVTDTKADSSFIS